MEKKQLDVGMGLLYAGGLCLELLYMLTSPILSAEADLVSYMILQVYPSINPFSLTYPGLISSLILYAGIVVLNSKPSKPLMQIHLSAFDLCFSCILYETLLSALQIN